MDSRNSEYYENFDEVHGILMYKEFVQYWDDVETFQARPDDLVIATYPKSGKSPLKLFLFQQELSIHLEW